jgi:hypothetical protein
MLSQSGNGNHPNIMEKAFILSVLNLMLTRGISYVPFIRLEKISFYFYFESFSNIMNGCLIFVKCFSESIVKIIWDFFYSLLI